MNEIFGMAKRFFSENQTVVLLVSLSHIPNISFMSNLQPKHDPYAALRVRNFRLYILTRLVNNIGFQIFDVAVAWQYIL